MSEITGKLIIKGETKEYGSNGFTKREFVIETESQYPQKIQLELIKDKCALLDALNIGDQIKVAYNVNGREWVNPQGETKYFNSIQGWRIDALNGSAQPETANVSNEPVSNNKQEEDDLPF